MEPEKILNLLLSQLPLDSATTKFIREIFLEILSSYRSLRSSTCLRKESPSIKINDLQLQDTAAKLREVIAFFNSADDDRDEFLVRFPDWEATRKLNIQKLHQTADSIQESREICSAAQIVGGGVGVIGGLAVIGSILFPPAATVLWPSFLLPAAATATSALAVGGSIAAGAGSIAQVVTSVTEATILSNRIEEAKKICLQDKESFDRMMRWFERTYQLETVLNHLFGTNIMDIIFRDLKEFFGSSTLNSKMFRNALTNSVGKIAGIRSKVNPSFRAAVTAVTFSVFLMQRRNRCLFQYVILTNKIGLGLTTAFNAKAQLTRLVASTVMKKGKGKLIRRALASKVALGAFAGIGIALDLANIVLNAEDLEKGSKSEVQKKIIDVAAELQTNLYFISDVYKELWSAAKKASEDFLNVLIIDQLGMNRTVIIIAHKVYQDILQETRRLRTSGRNLTDNRGVTNSRSLNKNDNSFNSLCKVIDFFNQDEELAIFRNYFLQWVNTRKENIAHLHLILQSLQDIKTLRSTARFVAETGGGVSSFAGQLQRFIDPAIVTYKTTINNSNATKLVAQLRMQIEETRIICRRDEENFIKLDSWFQRMHELNSAFDDLFGEGMFDAVFTDLKVVCDGGIQKYRRSSVCQEALKSCVRKIFSHPLQRYPLFEEAAIAAIFAKLLDGGQSSWFNLNCLIVTNRIKFRRSSGRRWTNDLTKNTDEENSVIRALERVVVEGRVGFLNTVQAVMNSANIEENGIRVLNDELQNELDSMKTIWRQLLL